VRPSGVTLSCSPLHGMGHGYAQGGRGSREHRGRYDVDRLHKRSTARCRNLASRDADSAAERVAAQATGANVVKAFNIFPASTWTPLERSAARQSPVVALAGDHQPALQLVSTLARHVGGTPAVLGPPARARQIEDSAGFVIGLAFAGQLRRPGR
jgi:predicted dinucleotide-binding enzyme